MYFLFRSGGEEEEMMPDPSVEHNNEQESGKEKVKESLPSPPDHSTHNEPNTSSGPQSAA